MAKEYTILRGMTYEILEFNVNREIKKWWEPVWWVSFIELMYVQPMILPTKD